MRETRCSRATSTVLQAFKKLHDDLLLPLMQAIEPGFQVHTERRQLGRRFVIDGLVLARLSEAVTGPTGRGHDVVDRALANEPAAGGRSLGGEDGHATACRRGDFAEGGELSV
jgi:hypothetical protein